MGRTYSLNGFLNAALRRSSKTVLVEGPSDKYILHRIELERYPTKAGGSAIDHAGMLDDPLLAGMGNRSKVLEIQARADALASAVPKISDVLAILTDREWDGVSFVAFTPQPMWCPPVQQKNRFITTGHSIENYHFDIECAVEFLKYTFPEHVSAALLAKLQETFNAMLVFATVLSLKIRDDSCIGRCGGLVDPAHIAIRDGRVYLDANFGTACAARGIASAATLAAETNLAVDAAWTELNGKSFTQWLPHGHIGEEILWSAVAKVALLTGVPVEVTQVIAHGHKKERDRFKAQWLSKLAAARRAPLDDAVDWLNA